MDENVSLEFLRQQLEKLHQGIQMASNESRAYSLNAKVAGDIRPEMDVTTYRLDQVEKRAEAADARMVRIEGKLSEIQVTLAGLATKDSIRNWGLAVVAIVLATGLGLGAILLQSSGNQLSAFQSGLSAIQAVSSAHDLSPSPPGKP